MSLFPEHQRTIRNRFYTIYDSKQEVPEDLTNEFGVQQWADESYNFMDKGLRCPNRCLYCYMNPINHHFGRDEYEDTIVDGVLNFRVNKAKVDKGWRNVKSGVKQKTIMMPSSHDIFMEGGGAEAFCVIATKMIKAGHFVLCVSKPRLDVIRYICDKMEGFKDKFMFRFTIPTNDNDLIKQWETQAPSFEERFESL